jgi:FAD/FMN-containing dehydrogenase
VTGGGVSFFSREKGLVCDNVLEFEVALTDGRLVVASQTQNADLYRALKGGSGNFGIVTRIKMVAFEFSGNMWW